MKYPVIIIITVRHEGNGPPLCVPLALALHDGVLDGEMLEVRLVQHPVVVDVVHVPGHAYN